MSALLHASEVRKHYGGVAALRDAHFELRRGEAHALIGGNGAGKSTLARILAGSTRPDHARIVIDGRPAAIATPLDAQRLGIAIIYQELDLFPHLTVGENIVIGNLRFPEGRFVHARRIEAFCRPFLDRVGLACPAAQPVSALSISRMQLLAIARALSQDARILLMDEPTSSLFGDDVERLFGLIRNLKSRGVSIVYVSHKMDEIFRICDRATVLRDGETAGTGEIASTTPAEIIRMMVGRDVETGGRPERPAPGEPVLSVERLSTRKLKDVSFELRRGEVLGIAGLVGSGRSALGAALFGIDPLRSGAVRFRGAPWTPRSPRDAIRGGLGLLPEDRRLQGLMMQMSVIENGVLGWARGGFIRRRRERSGFEPEAARMALACHRFEDPVSTLSGGNQQKALVARWLLLNPDVLFLDDPTRGIDIAARQDIYRIIDELAAAGKAIILVSSELPELLRCADRILVLHEGRPAAVYDAAQATQEQIMASATSVTHA